MEHSKAEIPSSSRTQANLRDISDEDLKEFFDHVEKNGRPWGQVQAWLIGDAWRGLTDTSAIQGLFKEALRSHGLESALACMWTMSFQAGRHFENRLMAKAMREGK